MKLQELITILTQRLWILIAGLTLAMILCFLAIRFFTPWPRYQATATVLVGNTDPDADWTSLQMARELTPVYAQWATRRPVLQGVIADLRLPLSPDKLQKRIDVNVVGNTPLLEISATADDPEQAAEIANGIVQQLTTQVKTISANGQEVPSSSMEDIARLQILIDDTEAELVALSEKLAYQSAVPSGEDVTLLETHVDSTRTELADLTDQLLKTTSEEKIDLLTKRINVLQSNLSTWRAELDSAHANTETDSETEFNRLTRRINILQSNLGIWQRELEILRDDVLPRPAIHITLVEEAQAPAEATNPLVNVLLAGITGLTATAGVILLLETQIHPLIEGEPQKI